MRQLSLNVSKETEFGKKEENYSMLMMRINANGYQKTNNLAISQCERTYAKKFFCRLTYLIALFLFFKWCVMRPILHAFPDVLSWLLLLLLKKLNYFSTHYYSILFLTTKEEKKKLSNWWNWNDASGMCSKMAKAYKNRARVKEGWGKKKIFVSFVNNIFILIVHWKW